MEQVSLTRPALIRLEGPEARQVERIAAPTAAVLEPLNAGGNLHVLGSAPGVERKPPAARGLR